MPGTREERQRKKKKKASEARDDAGGGRHRREARAMTTIAGADETLRLLRWSLIPLKRSTALAIPPRDPPLELGTTAG